METEIKNTVAFIIAPKKIKFFSIQFTNIHDTYAENCKMQMNEIKDLINQETYLVHGLEDSVY